MYLHFCGHGCGPLCQADRPARPGSAQRGRRPFTVDLHCHVLVPAVEALVAGRPQKMAEPGIMRATMGEASVAHNNAVMLPKAFLKLTNIHHRLADMDEMGVDVQVVSPSPTQYYYWADDDLAERVVAVQNEAIAELAAAHPGRIVGLGTAALQNPAMAVAQLRRAVRELGLKGVEISTSVNGKELSDPALRPFWAEAEALGATVFIHPFGTTLGDRTNTHYLVNTIGQPLETTVALSHLIFGGVLDAYPGLKIVAAHGGGYLPTYPGRSRHAWQVRPEAAADALTDPAALLRRIWYDTVVYDAVAVRHLIDRVGVSQVVVGTDYPFDMGHYDVHGLIGGVPGLDDPDRAAILGGNAAALLGLEGR